MFAYISDLAFSVRAWGGKERNEGEAEACLSGQRVRMDIIFKLGNTEVVL